jgi:hypothetical protein
VTCETCGFVGNASSVEEARHMKARHEEQDLAAATRSALDSVSQGALQTIHFEQVRASHSLSVT